ncbi:MAG: bifunctional demethylmenaquinone methyltransferase/2-methoxy-6-polyprenyl-1,4-benzoquinol methylase UbiE [Bacteroidia bacterium]|nr:MAG: bifunctional demethylmenaquinone methyltransferase/2-methoxy-6-polyprenyl-1,4-benzoquinol methylase UbiE [Bacteroidia bacterium]
MPKRNVEGLFNRIARRYDRLNRLISLGWDAHWREVCIRRVMDDAPADILDLACGTGSLTLSLAERMPDARITGADFAAEMLSVAEYKMSQRGLAGRLALHQAAAEQLPFGDHSFDAITCAFGVRNFADIHQAMRECRRVLRPGGCMTILELAMPTGFVRRQLFKLYAYSMLPLMGWIFARAFHEYLYLPRSIAAFSRSQVLFKALEQAGFSQPSVRRMNLGSVILVYVRA